MNARQNESAASLGWLMRVLELDTITPSSPVRAAWLQTRRSMLGLQQRVIELDPWPSDFWLAKGAELRTGFFSPVWDPPANVDDWPAFDTKSALAGTVFADVRTQRLIPSVSPNTPPAAPDSGPAVDTFMKFKAEIAQHADVRMTQVEHVRAWLGASVGHLLMSVFLTPPGNSDQVRAVAVYRLSLPRVSGLFANTIQFFEERSLEMLYNSRMLPDGQLALSDIKIGQGEEWREHWSWLSRDLGAPEMLEAVQLAAALMRSSVLAEALLQALVSAERDIQTIALAVLRRWILTLKAMSWLEAALTHSWTHVRAQDLACVAFNTVKPEWPRRLVAISHRSADAKPTLMSMKLWHESRCAIDANYVPAWETNTGMMWGLFASAPVIVCVRSPGYLQSKWCRREAELTQYLMEGNDFLPERTVIDVQLSELPELDQLAASWGEKTESDAIQSPLFARFPPVCEVWAPIAMEEWEVKMYRASGVLRAIHQFVSDPQVTNEIALYVQNGGALPGPAPTNHPGGWPEYGRILRDAHRGTGGETHDLAVRLPLDYHADERAQDERLLGRVPDLSSGAPRLDDILAGLEWLRVEWPQMLAESRADRLLINMQGLPKDVWENDERVSALRGIAAMRTSIPIWILQLAGQNADEWALVGERPIFTEHVDTQFSWMVDAHLPRKFMQAHYPAMSRMLLCEDLLQMCRAAGQSWADTVRSYDNSEPRA